MKINNLQSESALAATTQQSRASDLLSLGKAVDSLSQASGAAGADAVSLSGVASGIDSSIRAQASQRQSRIQEIQRQIHSGSYSVEAKDLRRSIVRDMATDSGRF